MLHSIIVDNCLLGRLEILLLCPEDMCGIFGCISEDAADKVLEGLSKLEYRGYDSAGLAAIFPDQEGPVQTERTTGYVAELVSKADRRFDGSRIAIGHTRWATHGRVTDSNAHPHSSSDGTITMVHNGIIENASELLQDVQDLGYEVTSETDSEVIVHLFDHELKSDKDASPLVAFNRIIGKLEGSWAIAVVMTGLDGILIARDGAPLVIGTGKGQMIISSDIQPLYSNCEEVAYLSEGDVFLVKEDSILGPPGIKSPKFSKLEGEPSELKLGNFPHIMLKEIHDQPVSLSNVLSGRISPHGSRADLDMVISREEITNLERINLVACGSAFYAAQIGVHYLVRNCEISIEAFRASEFAAPLYCNENTLTIAISQSGETKDTLDALKSAKECGSKISSICNVVGSTIARFAGNGVYLHAGPEYAVASTKVFTNMVASLLMFAMMISDKKEEDREIIIKDMRKLPNMISKQLLEIEGPIEEAISHLDESSRPIYIGRGISSFMAQEGALKMMEESYIPCISYPGGELKHGPIALIDEGTPVIALAPNDEHLRLMESSIIECKSRGAKIILISESDSAINNLADVLIPIFPTIPELSPFSTVVPLQLLSYKMAIKLGLNPDRPRNLAKSVTVS